MLPIFLNLKLILIIVYSAINYNLYLNKLTASGAYKPTPESKFSTPN